MKFLLTLLATVTIGVESTSAAKESDIIADINYGDTRDTVTTKLSNSTLVSSSRNSTLFARIGINGAFKTTRKLAGLEFSLYFDWDNDQRLKEVTYRSETIPYLEYDHQLKDSWQNAINLISAVYGETSSAGQYPQQNGIQDSQIQFSHEWKSQSGYIYLGIGYTNKTYNLSITFSQFSL